VTHHSFSAKLAAAAAEKRDMKYEQNETNPS